MKKCPYCSKMVDDVSVFCQYCGGKLLAVDKPYQVVIMNTPTSPEKKKSRKVLFIILGIIAIILIACFILSAINSQSPQYQAEKAATETKSYNLTMDALVYQFSNPGKPTPIPKLNMDMMQFVSTYDSMTDIQKKSFVSDSVGKYVDWSGEVSEVSKNGTITIHIPETITSDVNLKGVPLDQAANLVKGQKIYYTGKFESVDTFLGVSLTINIIEGKLQTQGTNSISYPTAEVFTNSYNIGDVVKVGNLEMTVNGISFPAGDSYFMPDDGKKFIAVDVTFENKGTESVSLIALMQMTLKDDAGYEYTQDMSADIAAGSNSPSGEIAPGEKKRGNIGFQVPLNAKGFQFVYDSSIFSSGRIFVDLGQ